MRDKTNRLLFLDPKKKESEYKVRTDLWPHVGGIGIGRILLSEYPKAAILASGPLCGFFPGCDILLKLSEEKEIFESCDPDSNINFLNLSALIVTDRAVSPVTIELEEAAVKFKPSDAKDFLLKERNIANLKIVGTNPLEKIRANQEYQKIYLSIENTLSNIPSTQVPNNQKTNGLAACLIAQSKYQEIYNQIATSFACLNSLEYPYSHEDLEEAAKFSYN